MSNIREVLDAGANVIVIGSEYLKGMQGRIPEDIWRL